MTTKAKFAPGPQAQWDSLCRLSDWNCPNVRADLVDLFEQMLKERSDLFMAAQMGLEMWEQARAIKRQVEG